MQAIRLQLVTAFGALLGTVIGLMSAEIDQVCAVNPLPASFLHYPPNSTQAATSYILAFTAGGFIYIATVTILPELLQVRRHSLAVYYTL